MYNLSLCITYRKPQVIRLNRTRDTVFQHILFNIIMYIECAYIFIKFYCCIELMYFIDLPF